MAHRRLTTLVVLALTMVAGYAGPAWSQPAEQPQGSTWDGVRRQKLTTVYVRDTEGVNTTGKLLAFAPDALVLLVNGQERRIARERVLRVQTRDSLKNGTIIGGVTGLVLGVLTAGIADCPSETRTTGCPGMRTSLYFVSAAIYAGLGAGIDAMIPGRTTIYQAPLPSRTTSLRDQTRGMNLAHATISW